MDNSSTKSKKKRMTRPVPTAIKNMVNDIFKMYSANPKDKLSPNESRMFVRDLALKHMTRCKSKDIEELMLIVDK